MINKLRIVYSVFLLGGEGDLILVVILVSRSELLV